MDGAQDAIIDWPRSIKAIWAERLAAIANRDGGSPHLAGAWERAAVECRRRDWELRAIVPLKADPQGHQWAVVLGRDDGYPPPNLVFIHGTTPTAALVTSVAQLEAGIEIPA